MKDEKTHQITLEEHLKNIGKGENGNDNKPDPQPKEDDKAKSN